MKGNGKNGKVVEVREIVPSEDRRERFANEYLLDLNATNAYLRTYPDASTETAAANGSRLLGNAKVAARVAELQAERANRVQISQDDILRELLRIGLSDVRHFTVDDLGRLLLAEGAPEEAWRAVASVKHRITSGEDFTVREVEYRLWNKNNALELLGKHIGLFPNRMEHSGPGGGKIPHQFTFEIAKAGAQQLEGVSE